jgi:hypothetical protein
MNRVVDVTLMVDIGQAQLVDIPDAEARAVSQRTQRCGTHKVSIFRSIVL